MVARLFLWVAISDPRVSPWAGGTRPYRTGTKPLVLRSTLPGT